MFAEEYVLSDLYFSTVIGEYEYEVGALLYRNERLHAPYHWHEGLEFQLNVAGDVIYEIEDKTYRVSDHNYVIIGANVGHRETVVIKETKVAQPQSYCISFKTNRIRKARSKIANLVREDEFIHDVLSSVNHLVGEYDDSTVRLFDDMLEEIQSQQPGYYTRVQALLAEILVDIVRYCRPMANSSRSNHIKPIRKSPDDSKFEIITEFFSDIYMGLSKDPSIDALAKKLFLSSRQINRLVVKYYGMTFAQKLSASQLDRAMDLLRSTQMPVAQIGEACGFSNSKYFSVRFKDYTGYTPTEFRKFVQKNIN